MRSDLFPIPIVKNAEDLESLAVQINAEHEAGEQNALERLQHYRAAGVRLIQAKDRLAADNNGSSHGKWGPWLKKNVKIKERMVQRYMRFAKSVTMTDLEDEEENWRKACSKQDEDEPEQAPEYVTLAQWDEAGKDVRKQILRTEGDAKFNAQGDNENIEWALWSWNPVTGCLHNCPYCYARDIADRFYVQKFEPSLWPARLNAPANTTFPEDRAAEWMGHKNVFVCSMADLFGRWVPKEWIDAVLSACRNAPQWNFLFLTKFPIRMAEFDFPDNCWVGTSVDCQARVANAEKSFRKVKAAVKWLSCEPLIEPLKFSDIGAFDWIVLGGASRSTQTPEWHPPREWVNTIQAAAKKAGVRVYEKSNLLVRIKQYPGVDDETPKEAPAELRYLPTVEAKETP